MDGSAKQEHGLGQISNVLMQGDRALSTGVSRVVSALALAAPNGRTEADVISLVLDHSRTVLEIARKRRTRLLGPVDQARIRKSLDAILDIIRDETPYWRLSPSQRLQSVYAAAYNSFGIILQVRVDIRKQAGRAEGEFRDLYLNSLQAAVADLSDFHRQLIVRQSEPAGTEITEPPNTENTEQTAKIGNGKPGRRRETEPLAIFAIESRSGDQEIKWEAVALEWNRKMASDVTGENVRDAVRRHNNRVNPG